MDSFKLKSKLLFLTLMGILLFCGFLTAESVTPPTDQLEKSDIVKIMDQIFKQHVDKKEMSATILKNSFRIYFEQFDPDHLYLLQSEVDPWINISDNEMKKYVERYQKEDFSEYVKMNATIQKAIERARAWREEMFQDKDRLFVELKALAPLPTTTAYFENLHRHYAKNLEELKKRQKLDFLRFLQMEVHRFGINAVKNKQAHVFAIYNERLNSEENPYLCQNDAKKPFCQEEAEHQFVLHILKSLAKSLDAHTTFFNNAEAYDMRVRLEKGYEGIGIVLQEGLDGVYVKSIVPGGPAEKSGAVHVNDQIVSIDGQAVGDSSLGDVMNQIHGTKNPSIALELKRKSEPDPIKVTLVREKLIDNQDRVTVTSESFGDGIIGRITLNSFYQNENGISSEKDVSDAIHQLQQKGKLIGLVLDFRQNSGGYLGQAVKVVGLFITKGVVVIAKYSNGEERFYRDLDGKRIYDGPLVILTSKLTASAAEIVAQALQDYGVALVVGDEHTYGKGSIQSQTITNSNHDSSSYFKVTIGTYYTPSGNSPQRKGVLDDIVVPSEFNQEDIGEEYLDFPLSNDKIAPSFKDSLSDVQSNAKGWYLKYYLPYLQKPESLWRGMIPVLRENSRYRIEHNKNFQVFLKKIGVKTAVVDNHDEENEEELLASPKPKNFGKEDLQAEEAFNIVKDMIILRSDPERVYAESSPPETEH